MKSAHHPRSRTHHSGKAPRNPVALMIASLDEHSGRLLAQHVRPQQPPRSFPVAHNPASHKSPQPGDRFLARIVPSQHNQSREAHVIRVIPNSKHNSRARRDNNEPVVCLVDEDVNGSLILLPAARKPRGPLIPKNPQALKKGDIVRARTTHSRNGRTPNGRTRNGYAPKADAEIIENPLPLTAPQSPPWSALSAIELNIPKPFPKRLAPKIENNAALPNDRDMRSIPFVTIDPHDARDHDDAVHAQPDPNPKNPNGALLHIAISDVSRFIPIDSPTDMEARRRSNSTYLPDAVVHMLPESLAADLCSLKENVERYAVVLSVALNSKGLPLNPQFSRGVVRVRHKLSYQDAQSLMDDASSARPLSSPQEDPQTLLKNLQYAHRLLQINRQNREPLNVNIPETSILFQPSGIPHDAVLSKTLPAHQLIEDLMVLANSAAAQVLLQKNVPTLFRFHEKPPADKLHDFLSFLKAQPKPLSLPNNPKPRDFNQLIRNAPNPNLIAEFSLRAQSRASYQPKQCGHFGLQIPQYTHFTSPIRRYADLVVHRSLLHALSVSNADIHPDTHLQQLADQLSETEKISETAERRAVKRHLAHLIQSRVGNVMDAVVVDAKPFGVFAQLSFANAQGFIPIASFHGPRLRFNSQKRSLSAQHGVSFRPGDGVRVRIERSDPLTGDVRLALAS